MNKSARAVVAVALLMLAEVGSAQAQLKGPAIVGSPNVIPAWYHAHFRGATLVDGHLWPRVRRAVEEFTKSGKTLQPNDRIVLWKYGSRYTYLLRHAGSSGKLLERAPGVIYRDVGSLSFAFYRAIEAASRFFLIDPNVDSRADRNLENYSFLVFSHDPANYWVQVIPAPARVTSTDYVGCFNGVGQRRLYKVDRRTYAVSYVLKNGSCGA